MYTVSRNGQQLGPYTIDQVNSLVAQGQIAPTDLIFTQGWTQWKTVGEIISPTTNVTPPIPQASSPKKSGGVLKGCLIATGVVAGLGLIGFIGCIVLVGGAASSIDEDNVSVGGKKVEGTRNISVGETITLDDVEITITKLEVKQVIGDPNFLGTRAASGGIYVCVLWKCKNISNKSLGSFSMPRLHLYANGNEYDADIGASGSFAAEENIDRKIFSDLNPGITVTDSDVFEIAVSILSSGNAYLEFDDASGVRLPVTISQ